MTNGMIEATSIRRLAGPATLRELAGLVSSWLTDSPRSRCVMTSKASHDATRLSTDSTQEDLCDITAARAGDSNAYQRLIVRYQDEITRQMYRFSRHRAVCEELVHDVFVEAFLSLKSYRGDAPWLHWLRRIAVRVGYRFWKKRRSDNEVTPLTEDDWNKLRNNADPVGSASDAAELVHSLLSRLAPADRLILTLLHLDGCSMSEAAARGGWTVMGAKLRAFRARNRLRLLLERGDS